MERRRMLKLTGGGLLGLAVGGCAPSARPVGVHLPRVQAGWGRVIRSVVGLRPFRPQGIRVEAEPLGSKLMIHNYGHGGAGISLAWGTGHLAAEKAQSAEARQAAVIGAGAVGLATARQLQSRGFDVTIYSRAVWPDETLVSGHAPARFTPSASIIDPDHRTPAFDAFYERVASLSYRYWHGLVGQRYGVHWRPTFRLADQPSGQLSTGPSPTGVGETIEFRGNDHPFPSEYVVQRATMMMDMPVFLNAVLSDFRAWGGRVVIRTFDGPESLMSLDEPILVNCTGLGAREVCGDADVIPISGQLTVMLPQSEIEFIVTAGGMSMVPRSDGLMLGGAPNRIGSWTVEPDELAAQVVVERAIEVFGGMRGMPGIAGPSLAFAGNVAPDPVSPAVARFPASELTMELEP